MGPPRPKPATYQDLLTVPEHLVGEILDGELHTSPRPSARHALATTNLTSELVGPFGFGRGGGSGGWIILVEPELHLIGQIVVPDLAGWRRARMPVLPEAPFFDLAPDWVCEVISPSTGALDRGKKMPHYARAGVGHIWLVDPILPLPQTLEVFRSDEEGWRLLGTFTGQARVRAEPFDAIELDLAVLWAR
jgi:Uma2 family endonuclease